MAARIAIAPGGTASGPRRHPGRLAPSGGYTPGPVLLRDDSGGPPPPDWRPGPTEDPDPASSAGMSPGCSWRPLGGPPMIVDVYHGSHKKISPPAGVPAQCS